MNNRRREILKSGSGAALLGLLAAAGIITPEAALAEWNKDAFAAKSVAAVLRAIGATPPAESKEIQFASPDIAENGMSVPIGISSTLPNVTLIAILVENNPSTLAASFILAEGTLANIQTKIKMAQSSHVYALVRADGRFFFARKEIRVTLGGCAA